MKTEKPTAINVFCGSGSLSMGLKKAGFRLLAGIELDPEIAKTFRANHRRTKLIIKDVREIMGKEIFDLVGDSKIDLIAGCPPCQGFSQLTEKYKREDSRNFLILEMARLVAEVKPSLVMMENVAGIVTKGKPILDEFLERLKKLGYLVNMDVLQMADYGVPQSRRRFVLFAGRGFKVPLPCATHSRKGDTEKGLKPWVTLSEVIKDMPEPVTLSHAIKNGGPGKFNWHVVRDLKEVSMKRLEAMKEGDNRLVLPRELRPKCHKHRKRGFVNVYGRLRWDHVASTITSGCATPAMGRFGHPEKPRTISIREAALIQTFPENYKFDTRFIKRACNLVGNALPYKFAHLAAKNCVKALDDFA